MVAGALLGLGLKYAAPKLIGEAISSGVATVGSKYVAGRAMNFAAGAAGQRVLAKTVGTKMAARIASPTGQKLGNYVVRHDISNRVQGEGNFAPPKNITNPKPVASTKDNIDPYGHTLKPASGPTVSVPGPGRTPSGPSVNVGDRPPTGRELAQQFQQRRQARKAQRGQGGEATGWLGTGKGWWQQNEQVNFGQAFGDPTKMGSFDVARGPTRAALPLPGRKLGQGLKQGIREGVAAHRAGVETPEFDTDMIGKQIGVPSMPTTPTAPSVKPPSINAPAPRTAAFNVGTQTATPEPVTTTPKKAQGRLLVWAITGATVSILNWHR